MAGILTRCAACLVEIPHTAPRCGRCHTRYCGEACQREHWKQQPTHPWSSGPHEKFCKTIKKAGGAEQHYANTKYLQAVKTAEDCCDTSTKDKPVQHRQIISQVFLTISLRFALFFA